MKLTRANIFKQMVHFFRDEGTAAADITFFLPGEGVETGGVHRDVYSCFWAELFGVAALGQTERVPCVRSDKGITEWTAVGRIILKGYKDVGFFPIKFCKAFLYAFLFGAETLTPDTLLTSLKRYVSNIEANILSKALSTFIH